MRRHFDRIEFVAENTRFYFDPDSPLSRAADANLTPSLLAVEKIVAEDEKTGEMLIEADKLFLTQSLTQVKPTPDPNADPKTTWSLGTLSESQEPHPGRCAATRRTPTSRSSTCSRTRRRATTCCRRPMRSRIPATWRSG